MAKGELTPLKALNKNLAEAVRFELTEGCPSAVFKTAGLNHSPKLPYLIILYFSDVTGFCYEQKLGPDITYLYSTLVKCQTSRLRMIQKITGNFKAYLKF